eukprot:6914521-Karenia_brevis.AAC.1
MTPRRLLLLEGVLVAANRASKQGRSGARWEAACHICVLLHTLVAVLAVKYKLVALPRANW